MSLLAVLVGAFLVYNAMAFAVVQRSPTFAVLRMLGTTPRQLFNRLLLEAVVLGLIGGVLGLLLGLVLGQSLLVLVTRTVSDLFVAVEATRPDIDAAQLLTALGVTLAAVLLATLAPARDAARTAPVALERESTAQETGGSRILPLVGLALMLACPLLIAASGRSLVAGFVALTLLIAGYVLLSPGLIRLLLDGMIRMANRGGSTRLRLALRGVQSALPRTGPALVALAVAVSATVGVTIMIGSFRASVTSWLDTTLQGDLYVYREAEGDRLTPDWQARLAELPGVESVAVARHRRLILDGEPLRVMVLDGANAGARHFEVLSGPADAGRQLFEYGTGALISEPLANRRGLAVDDLLTLATPTGEIELKVLGVYRDYSSSWGAAVMPFTVYGQHWQDRELSSLALTLAPDADSEALRQGILAMGATEGMELSVVSNRAIRERSLVIFDRTFLITDVLRALVILVAFVGIVSALLALFMERRREFAVLRATGLTPGQLQGQVIVQSATGGLIAGLLALPLGCAMSLLLINVINRRSFGWTLGTHIEGSVILEALLLAVAAAALAALWPARRLAGGDLREALYAP
jgi:putative ABC transport system permease protein